MIGHDLRKPLCVIRELAKVTGSIVRDGKISQVFVEELCEKEHYTWDLLVSRVLQGQQCLCGFISWIDNKHGYRRAEN